MTLTKEEEEEEKAKLSETGKKTDLATVLQTVLVEAQLQDRLTCGMYEAGKLLEMNPGGVMLCIVPVDVSGDVALHIHVTLIEAFCSEYNIRLIKVDSQQKICDILCGTRSSRRVSEAVARPSSPDVDDIDYSCVLVEYPDEQCSEAEEDLLEFHKKTCDQVEPPFINLSQL